MRSSKGAWLGVLVAMVAASGAQAAEITVNSTADAVADDGQCTLREAMTAAEGDAATGGCAAGSGADRIAFSITGTITVGSVLPIITKDLTIDGPGAQHLALDGAGASRLFVLNAGKVRIEDLTLRRAFVDQAMPGPIGNPAGAAILNRADTIVQRVHFAENSSTATGGAVYNEGTFQVLQSAFTGNSIRTAGSASALFTYGNTVVYNSTVTGNDAGPGGGSIVTAEGPGNRPARLVVVGSTIAGNTGQQGGGIAFAPNNGNQGLFASIVSGNAGAQCTVAPPAGTTDANVTSDASCGPSTVADPKLGALGLNGGSTPVFPIAADSPAIDRFKDASFCSADSVMSGGLSGVDQRGVPRPAGACDAGAFEFVAAAAAGGCANGVDDDRDGFTDDRDPDCISGRGVEDRVDNTAIACADRDIVLTDVVRSGSRVRVFGLADPSLAGGIVEIVTGGEVVRKLTIATDGSFSGTVAPPARRAARTARYLARLGGKRSANLKLQRRLTVSSLSRAGTRVVMRGRVARTGGRRATIELLARSGDCRSGFAVIGRGRLARNGTFRISASAPANVTIAIFRARVSAGGRTFSLPRALRLR